ncbi:PhnE/PtxC family ABC transporter permease [Aliiruegeria lutimaris]|uniref:Phosphonate transport system permease protein n=1 Tax=Aliiruegeria lutimaris TaxID=571298 RepID=A0A1G9BZM0_9RHOB|nr:hypothetical protein [Aliiruegeria lutimaris]SDK44644.1 phosphonate transport system permease protein [Aliiruegeria lutimaris]
MADAATNTPDRIAQIHSAYMALARRKRLYSGLILALFAVLFVSGFKIAEDRNASGFMNGIGDIFDFPSEVVAEAVEKSVNLPGHLVTYFPALLETLNIAAVATILGVIVGTVLSLLSTRGLARFPRLIPVFRRLMDLMRAFPQIVVALVLIFTLGFGPVPAMIAIAIHTAGAIGKLYSEINENADLKPVEGLTSVMFSMPSTFRASCSGRALRTRACSSPMPIATRRMSPGTIAMATSLSRSKASATMSTDRRRCRTG